jgi:hypothetical protein
MNCDHLAAEDKNSRIAVGYTCSMCGEIKDNMIKCSKCNVTAYCSMKCQNRDKHNHISCGGQGPNLAQQLTREQYVAINEFEEKHAVLGGPPSFIVFNMTDFKMARYTTMESVQLLRHIGPELTEVALRNTKNMVQGIMYCVVLIKGALGLALQLSLTIRNGIAIPSDMVIYCTKCDKYTKCKMCGNCRSVAYCSVNCQRSNWSEHKSVCCKKDQTILTAQYILLFSRAVKIYYKLISQSDRLNTAVIIKITEGKLMNINCCPREVIIAAGNKSNSVTEEKEIIERICNDNTKIPMLVMNGKQVFVLHINK